MTISCVISKQIIYPGSIFNCTYLQRHENQLELADFAQEYKINLVKNQLIKMSTNYIHLSDHDSYMRNPK